MTLADAARRLKPPPSAACRRWTGPALILVSDPVRLADPLAVAARLPVGAAVLLRPHRDGSDHDMAVAVAALCRRRRLELLVAGDWRLADRLGADGLHLPEAVATGAVLAPALGWVRRRRRRLTVAAHAPRAIGRAVQLAADAVLLSPVFPTASHPGAPVLGPLRFGLWSRRVPVALIALGGVSAVTARRLPAGAACALAAIGGLSPRR